MSNEKAFRYLGLAAKAGKVASGGYQTEEAIRRGKAKVVFLAGDASENTKKRFADMCSFRKIPCFKLSDRETLGARIGRGMRSSLAVTDESLAGVLIDVMREVFSD